MDAGEEIKKKRPLVLNFDTLLREDEPCIIEIVKSSKLEAGQSSPCVGFERCSSGGDGFEEVSDLQLEERLKSSKSTYQRMGKNLPDKGAKLLGSLRRLEAEIERRKVHNVELAAKESRKSSQPTSLSIAGVSNDSAEEAPSPPQTRKPQSARQFRARLENNVFNESEYSPHSRSSSVTGAFGGPRLQSSSSAQASEEPGSAKQFSEKKEVSRDCRTTSAFKKEFSFLRPELHMGSEVSQKKGRKRPRKSASPLSKNVKPYRSVFGQKEIFSSSYVGHSSQNLLKCFNKEDSSLLPNGLRTPKESTYVLVDEDEPKLLEMSENEDELSERMKEAKIYYPSSKDPEAVEIYYTDIKCLAPESYLSSTIMNFYIRFLQQQASSINKALYNYHFFNTYFYNKLKKAVSYKDCDREAAFVKFRRWWRGVRIFEKAYILIPLHEDQHWSLVIICMPDKQDYAGPSVLHLDSLGLHNSRAIFDDIKGFLIEEWNCLKQEVYLSGLPFADSVWENLPSNIVDRKIPVPQQKNDYDCGLFVLYFMQRFIQEAPERLKKRDQALFGKQWFKPEEASGLRRKILTLLKNEFKHVSEG